MLALPYAIPAAAAGLAYLNGRHALSYDWNVLSSLAVGTFRTVLEEKLDSINFFNVLESNARSSAAHHPWIIYQGQSWTYAQGYNIVLRYGNWLKTKGVQKNEIVAMDFLNSDVFIWLWFGLWSIGAKPAFINYNLTGAPLLHTIRTSTARLVLVDGDVKDNFAEDVLVQNSFLPKPTAAVPANGQQANYEFENDPSQPPSQPATGTRKVELVFFDKALEDHILLTLEPIREPDSARDNQKKPDMAMLIYTSGTTGLPKPAIVSWNKVSLASAFVSSWIPLKKSDILYTSMPLYHSSASLIGACATVRAATTISLGRKFSHTTFWPEVKASKATIVQYVGETCRYLLSAPPTSLDKEHHVRAAIGNGLRPDVWQPFKDRFGIETICEFYAATEGPAGMWNKSSNSYTAGAVGHNGTVAAILMGGSIALVQIDQSTSPPTPIRNPKTGLCKIAGWNEPGELLYKLDPNNIQAKFQGYFGNAQANESKIIRGVKAKGDVYYRTGDLMRWDRDNRWYFADRLGDTFRWKAENVSTAEVTGVMGTHEAIEEANVYGVQVPGYEGRAGCAAITLKPAFTLAQSQPTPDAAPLPTPQVLQSLAAALKKELPSFAVPLFLRVTQKMHTTGTNKTQKHLLQKEGIEIDQVEQSGDVLFWLREGTYERFTTRDLEALKGGGVKL